MLAFEHGEPGLSSGRVDAGLDPFREPQIVVGVHATMPLMRLQLREVSDSAYWRTVSSNRYRRLAPSRSVTCTRDLSMRWLMNVDDVGGVRAESSCHVLGRFQREAVDEDRQPA